MGVLLLSFLLYEKAGAFCATLPTQGRVAGNMVFAKWQLLSVQTNQPTVGSQGMWFLLNGNCFPCNDE